MSSAGSAPSIEVRHNSVNHRFEVELEGQLAVAEYERENHRIVFTHTYVPPELRGRGIAEELVLAGFAFARAERLHVIPACSYVDRYLKRHSEYDDLLAPG